MLDVKHTLRVLPIHVINPRADKERSVHIGEELESLIATLGGVVVDRVIQKLDNPDNATFIGKGKVVETTAKIEEQKIDVVVLNAMANPRQVFALKRAFQKVNPQIDVWDRIDLILHIFDKHATTTEAKLQIEIARMRYMGPRIYGMGYIMSRQGGRIGTVGVGETNTELMKRHWREEMKRVNDQLEKVSKQKEQQLEKRKRAGLKTVSIVGYTNAGKSSLFNALTKKKTLVENVLFATLDSNVGKLYIPTLGSEVLITDTIGFIRSLPPRLINAFKSTLMESVHADSLLHVIDISDPEVHAKVTVVKEILMELGIKMEHVVYVFNKIDAVPKLNKEKFLEVYAEYSPLFISVKNNKGLEEIQKTIVERFYPTVPSLR